MLFDIATSILSSTARGWRGTNAVIRTKQPEEFLVLYDMEGCPYCRPVRETLTELDLNVLIKPCPNGQAGHWAEVEQLSGQRKVPCLLEPNSGQWHSGSEEIISFLYANYGAKAVKRHRTKPSLSKVATGMRGLRGLHGITAKCPEQALVLYSFESSPFSRLVRERLTELGLPYMLYNAGKQQLADQGLSWLRPALGEYKPVPGSNREKLLTEAGKVQIPYLFDPNTGKRLFESRDIIKYLDSTYRETKTP
ncbi:glutathione S-transferase N-terminal domain-containing protein [Salinisphaera sp.]|uniref:glutathione S-transferase N-terminal domain-containing protein n=1 Tax=Salinisphaera sp. TaxID=1914330 RepID=UPI000C3EA820|nr:glutathione S-transferase N-terminal domain-containing protein [Salinisphaera sp.]MBS61786.1 hypothetical protein [Salinisphaera sp.]